MKDKSQLMLKQENLELDKENQGLKETVTKLLQEVERLRSVPSLSNNPNRIVLSREQRIIEDQIERFELISLTQQLSLDDCRALDLLIKNKRLLDVNIPIEPDYTKVPDGKSESDLLRIAGNVEKSKYNKRTKSKTSKKDPVA